MSIFTLCSNLFYSHTFLPALFLLPPPKTDPSSFTTTQTWSVKERGHPIVHPTQAEVCPPVADFHSFSSTNFLELWLCVEDTQKDKIMALSLKTSWSDEEKATYLTYNTAQQLLWTKYGRTNSFMLTCKVVGVGRLWEVGYELHFIQWVVFQVRRKKSSKTP